MKELTPETHAPGATDLAIPLAVPNIGPLETASVLAAVESGFVSSVGPDVGAFEVEFADLVGSRHAIACSSGTAALHVAMILLGVERGDEVFCSDFTFVASVNPIAYLGATPVLVDSETQTWNLDPDLLEEELGRRSRAGVRQPKVVELVHVLGQPAQAERIAALCDRYGVALLEDAAESLGATWSSGALDSRHTGTVGAVGCFSFNGNKIATAGGGGMIVTDDEHLARRARHLTTQAKVPDIGYLHDEVGYNYRLTNLSAAVGRAQLTRLPEFVNAKREIADRYREAFQGLPLDAPPSLTSSDPTFWLYSVLVSDVETRNALIEHLATVGVQARALWRPIHAQPPFKDCDRLGGHVADELFARGVSLPCSTSLERGDQDRVIAEVLAFFTAS